MAIDFQKQHFQARREAIEFERLSLALLRAECLSSGRQVLVGPEAGSQFRYMDAVIPGGWGNLPGPTVVEVTNSKSLIRIQERLTYIKGKKTEIGSFLLVFNSKGTHFDRISQRIKNISNVPIEVMGRDKLDALAKKHPAVALTSDVRFLNEAIGTFESQAVNRYTEQHLSALSSAFNEDQLVLFLGAGVSRSAQLPDWPTLLNRMMLELLNTHPDIAKDGKGEDILVEYLESETPPSPLIAARYLRDSVDNFPERVRRALYKTYEGELNSELIEAIGKLCLPERSRQGLLSVVNYNFDDLLERELERRSVNHHVVIGEENSPSRDELPIYHPHGFLPFKGDITSKHEDALVLSEDAYHSQFIDPYSWPNITQLNLLRGHVCLFIGLSMTDPNLRRLLEISQRKKPGARHYAVLRDHWRPSGSQTSEATTMAGRIYRGLEETSFARLGVSIIWIDDYGEIPDLIRRIRQPT